MTRIYRLGAVGALLDEYERAILDLQRVVATIPDPALCVIVDPYTANEDCRSVQTILAHVVSSGFGYATSICNLKTLGRSRPAKLQRQTIEEYLADLTSVFAFTEQVFQGIEDGELEQIEETRKIKAGWGQVYDIEQLMEHAIVHVLRHRRQLEKFILLLRIEPAK